MVVPPEETFRRRISDVVLRHRCPSKFTTENHKRAVEQTALLQIAQQTADCTIKLLAFDRQGFIDRLPRRRTVMVPSPIEQLNKSYT